MSLTKNKRAESRGMTSVSGLHPGYFLASHCVARRTQHAHCHRAAQDAASRGDNKERLDVRNVIGQYTRPENRIRHAPMTALKGWRGVSSSFRLAFAGIHRRHSDQ